METSSHNNENEKLRFAVVSDIHLHYRPSNQECDSAIVSTPEDRHDAFLAAAENWGADLVINLGDLHPRTFTEGPGKQALDAWREWSGETIAVMGNHDADNVGRKEYMEKMGMPAAYYSVMVDGWKFIILDSGDPAFAPGTEDEHPAEAQLAWLRDEIQTTPSRCVILVHNGTDSVFPGGEPPETTKRIIDEANEEAGYQKVAAYFWGHDHQTRISRSEGVYYTQINSTTYRWDSDVGPIFYRDPAPFAMGVLDNADGSLQLEGTGLPDNWAVSNCSTIADSAKPTDDMTYQKGTDYL